MLKRVLNNIRRLWRDENGSSTVEFVILFPAFIGIFISSYESGLMMVRNVMLERSVDLAVRDLRLGIPNDPTLTEEDRYKLFKENVCDNAMVADCMNIVQVQLQPVSTATWTPLVGDANCVDEASLPDPDFNPYQATGYTSGGNNELMLIRVCALFTPFFPGTTLGMQMPKYNPDDASDDAKYALVVTSAFVNEPSR
ncbi:MAG: TadE/TadG family type IV pilus assembly protein [Pseudomonadota bacterium]